MSMKNMTLGWGCILPQEHNLNKLGDSHAFVSVNCCLVVTCWKRAVLLALVGDVYCIFVTFPCDILGQVWYLIV